MSDSEVRNRLYESSIFRSSFIWERDHWHVIEHGSIDDGSYVRLQRIIPPPDGVELPGVETSELRLDLLPLTHGPSTLPHAIRIARDRLVEADGVSDRLVASLPAGRTGGQFNHPDSGNAYQYEIAGSIVKPNAWSLKQPESLTESEFVPHVAVFTHVVVAEPDLGLYTLVDNSGDPPGKTLIPIQEPGNTVKADADAVINSLLGPSPNVIDDPSNGVLEVFKATPSLNASGIRVDLELRNPDSRPAEFRVANLYIFNKVTREKSNPVRSELPPNSDPEFFVVESDGDTNYVGPTLAGFEFVAPDLTDCVVIYQYPDQSDWAFLILANLVKGDDGSSGRPRINPGG